MILLASIALAAAPAQAEPRPAAASARAQATIRIISAAELRFEDIERLSPQRLRLSTIRSTAGHAQPAKLVEFQ